MGGTTAPVGSTAPMDLFSLDIPKNYSAPPHIILSAAKAKGLEVAATFVRRNKGIFLDMTIYNKSMMVHDRCAGKPQVQRWPFLPLAVPK